MTPYPRIQRESDAQTLCDAVRERSRRYAAVEAVKFGHGGITYVASILGCAQSTIATGIEELAALPEGSGYDPRIRRQGGGRKPDGENHPGIDEAFLDVSATPLAVDIPMRRESAVDEPHTERSLNDCSNSMVFK